MELTFLLVGAGIAAVLWVVGTQLEKKQMKKVAMKNGEINDIDEED